MKQFDKPQKVDGPAKAFGGDMQKLLPKYAELPDEFKRHDGTRWNKIVSTWIFNGLPKGTRFITHEGIDAQEAINHIRAILASWEPKHEHKESGAAYLMSRWFKEIQIPE